MDCFQLSQNVHQWWDRVNLRILKRRQFLGQPRNRHRLKERFYFVEVVRRNSLFF
jgi:hypothetical protein